MLIGVLSPGLLPEPLPDVGPLPPVVVGVPGAPPLVGVVPALVEAPGALPLLEPPGLVSTVLPVVVPPGTLVATFVSDGDLSHASALLPFGVLVPAAVPLASAVADPLAGAVADPLAGAVADPVVPEAGLVSAQVAALVVEAGVLAPGAEPEPPGEGTVLVPAAVALKTGVAGMVTALGLAGATAAMIADGLDTPGDALRAEGAMIALPSGPKPAMPGLAVPGAPPYPVGPNDPGLTKAGAPYSGTTVPGNPPIPPAGAMALAGGSIASPPATTGPATREQTVMKPGEGAAAVTAR